ncbi:hypothetical protein SELMODRAFT_100184 [Selaginella moellendorffii]|uniref:Alpha-mannosidase n=1 Tax=Selaginella moellendorffii TaxID=88036 RepID=D8RSH3_SELML|nr:hypothetical protein SELMODRAFT_100184 [Selaginella moellendorffii]
MEVVFLLLVLLGQCCYAAYITNASVVAGKLNVHLVAHSHDDVGWIKTVDDYYVKKNGLFSLSQDTVKGILDSVLASLQENPDRKFVEVEQAFFSRWWNEQNSSVQGVVRRLVKSGQLEFANGGWCMHDEAATHYADMIDQTTLGHRFLKQEFDVVPRIGWQIDPFGHSAVQAYLLGTELGFDGLFFARIDYQDRLRRTRDKNLEFVWEGSNTLKSDKQLFTSVFLRHYNPPKGFDYEGSGGIIMQDDPSKGATNIGERVEAFVNAAKVYANATQTNHVMWTMGDDFKYYRSAEWYTEMDKLIHYVNKDGRVNALYSTPSIYLDAKHAADQVWNVTKNDFFPYADNKDSFWTGYYTSRPVLKGYVRALSGYLQAARQLEALTGKRDHPNTDNLWRALSVVQHHDGVSGTERQKVADDYARLLAIAASEAEKSMNLAASCLAAGVSPSDCLRKNVSSDAVQCPHLDISFCPSSENITSDKPLVVTAYNPLGWAREEYIQIPVSSNALIVTDATGKAVDSQLAPISDATKKLRKLHAELDIGVIPEDETLYSLVFKAVVPPLGFSSYLVKPSKPNENGKWFVIDAGSAGNSRVYEANITDSSTEYFWYTGEVGGQVFLYNSGAYIFRPADNNPTPVTSSVWLAVEGPLYKARRRQVSPWIYEEHRLYNGETHNELEITVGPIPLDDGVGKEVIVKVKANTTSNSKFYTDSNGRDFLERVRSKQVTQPVAGNYYPVNLGIYINDNQTDLSLLVDRASGASSINDGEVELMLHRRLMADDERGVSEALDEQVCIGSQECEGLTASKSLIFEHRLKFFCSRWRRLKGQRIYSPLQLFFSTPVDDYFYGQNVPKQFSMVKSGYALPDNVALLTIQELEDKSILVRLAHLFEAGEDDTLSKPANVQLKQLFWHWEIQGVNELSLSTNQDKSSMKRRMEWKVAEKSEGGAKRGARIDQKSLLVELGPMEIRTLQLTVKPKNVVTLI